MQNYIEAAFAVHETASAILNANKNANLMVYPKYDVTPYLLLIHSNA